jgi:hypothetical protein
MGVYVKRDSLGKIFRVEKRLGRGDEFEIISHFANDEVHLSRFHHEHCDGLGALSIESARWSGGLLDIPLFRLKSSSLSSEFLDGLRGFFDDFSPSTTHWKNLDPTAPYTPRHLAWRVFSNSSTLDLLRLAKSHKVSLNSLLLGAVNAAVAQLLLVESQTECRWLVPVNMRMTALQAQSTANHTSSVGVRMGRDESLQRIDATLRKSLNPWRVRCAHGLTQLISGLSEDVLYKLAKKRGEKNFWIGSFSNLGIWNFPDSESWERWPLALSIAPPAGTPCFPVGVGIITWQGKLSVSVRLHAGLVSNNPRLPEKLLEAVCDHLCEFGVVRINFFATSASHKTNE